jgi:hypothetical protein
MTAKDKQERPVFRPGGASRLLESIGEDMTDDERALLLAMIGVDAEAGGSLEESEYAALDRLKAQVEDYDADELTRAVEHMVTAKPRESRKLKWPKLKQGHSKRSPEE